MREVEKLRQFGFRALVIEGTRDQVQLHHYRSLIAPTSILASLAALMVRANVHVVWAGSPAGAAEEIEQLARQFLRGIEKDAARLN